MASKQVPIPITNMAIHTDTAMPISMATTTGMAILKIK